MLTAAETFTGPSLTDLIALARQGVDTVPAGIDRMLQSLQSQLTDGPLADLSSAAVDGDGFVQEVQSLESSYEQNVDQQLLPEFHHVDEILKLAGQAIVADVISLNQQTAVGLISSSDLITDAQTAIDSVTDGPILSLGTPLSGYSMATKTFEANLDVAFAEPELIGNYATGSSRCEHDTAGGGPGLSSRHACRARSDASLHLKRGGFRGCQLGEYSERDLTGRQLGCSVDSSASAISTFDSSLLYTTGLFGLRGVISQALAIRGTLAPNLTIPQTASATSSVTGTATVGGTATRIGTETAEASGRVLPWRHGARRALRVAVLRVSSRSTDWSRAQWTLAASFSYLAKLLTDRCAVSRSIPGEARREGQCARENCGGCRRAWSLLQACRQP